MILMKVILLLEDYKTSYLAFKNSTTYKLKEKRNKVMSSNLNKKRTRYKKIRKKAFSLITLII